MKKELYLAGGCFWGMQAYFEQLQGVLSTTVGYANGLFEDPTYEMVCKGNSGFAETLYISYDDTIISLDCLLSLYYEVIDPTSLHRQGHDIGTQYRTGIYYQEEGDKDCIVMSLQELSKQYDKAIVVECLPLKNFYPAEAYHQAYLRKNPGGYCHISRDKITQAKTQKVFK